MPYVSTSPRYEDKNVWDYSHFENHTYNHKKITPTQMHDLADKAVHLHLKNKRHTSDKMFIFLTETTDHLKERGRVVVSASNQLQIVHRTNFKETA